MSEPVEVQEARRTIRQWELRNGHDSYIDCLDGGWRGYQAACWDCDWRGSEYLRDRSKPMEMTEKINARRDAAAHRRETKP